MSPVDTSSSDGGGDVGFVAQGIGSAQVHPITVSWLILQGGPGTYNLEQVQVVQIQTPCPNAQDNYNGNAVREWKD